MFLSREELIELTGYRQPSKQRLWLDKQNVRYYLRFDNRVVVLKNALTPSQSAVEPNWSKRP